ncbi:MAG: hypothetical protein O2892_12450 [Actinomycetota bacterium]|jgi:serine/threonine protein kinase|nr:hypothetical protein [Actinomycetota bacterium]MDA2949833.1 hypothetical protein [Actinomycetota bacterium]
MTLGAGEVFAGYTVVRMLGSGGMGEVYLVQHPRLPRTEALKLLRPEISNDETFRVRFIREADSIAELDHPHIVTVYETPTPPTVMNSPVLRQTEMNENTRIGQERPSSRSIRPTHVGIIPHLYRDSVVYA